MIPITKPYIDNREAEAVKDVILSGWVAQGPKVKAFEDAFAEYTDAKHACAVSNCTTGLHLALLAVGVKPGDTVITVSHSFITTANVVKYCQAEPVFADIDLETYNISVEFLKNCLEENRDKKISAIIVVHQIGMPCNLLDILPLAKEYQIPVVEDAACGIGSEVSFDAGKTWEKIGRPHGDVACFSFHPRKLLTCGEGGMITTQNAEIDQQVRLLRHQGMSVSDLARHHSSKIVFEEYPVIGFNYRMTDMQAAMGIVQLAKLPKMIKRRRELADVYQKELADVDWIALPKEPDYCRTNWQSFAVRLKENAPLKRNELMQYLLDNEVSTRAGIMNAHEEKPYQSKKITLKNSEIARRDVVLIPLYPSMEDEQINRVIHLIKNAK